MTRWPAMLNPDINPQGFPKVEGVDIIRFEAGKNQANAKTRLRRVNTDTLMAKVFEPIRWIVPGYVPEGFSVLAGRQKLGKTWMAIDMALAVAGGGVALGTIDVEQ